LQSWQIDLLIGKNTEKVHNYLDELNETQRLAVENYKGPTLVIAGAGSGKTRVLTYRIAHLLRNGVHPAKILALTFTNKAAKEMKERIAKIVGETVAKSLWMGTFHSIFARILRFESDFTGFPSTFTIYDNSDSVSLIKKIIKDLNLDEKRYKPSEVYNRISKAKNELLTYKIYQNSALAGDDRQAQRPEIGRIYQIYAERCAKSSVMDFDDLLLNINILFEKNPVVLQKYQKRFEFILVDEYQDTNTAQYMILKRLAHSHHNICAVGDDSQSIYAFRGAKIENILNFQKDYPENKIIKLEQNYRSTKNIVEAANAVIAKNKRRIPKIVFTENEMGTPIKVIEASSDLEEGYIVVNNITQYTQRELFKYMDYAILYRTNAQSRIFEEHLRKSGIPYKIYGGLSFYQRKEIKDMLAYFRLVINNNDEEALRRIINYPKRGIGDTTFAKIEQTAVENTSTVWNVLVNPAHFGLQISGGAALKIKEFINMIHSFSVKAKEADAFKIAMEIARASGVLKDLFEDKSPESQSRHENVQELINGIKEFTNDLIKNDEEATLARYMEDVSLMTNDDNQKDENPDKVVLMTIHSAKGLEFNNVFVVGLEEGLFPSQMSAFSIQDLEEERRLFYVAITRAKKNLYLSSAKSRTRWGEFVYCTASRFMSEIDEQFLERSRDGIETFESRKKPELIDKRPELSSQKTNMQRQQVVQQLANHENKIYKNNPEISANFKADHPSKIKAGVNVEHQKFGTGTVMKIEGTMPNSKAIIHFQAAGEKTLLLKFAKLRVV